MFKKVHENEWVSNNKKWKVTVLVREFDGVLVSDINIFSRLDQHWKGENRNENLPKYVNNEIEKAKEVLNELKYNQTLI